MKKTKQKILRLIVFLSFIQLSSVLTAQVVPNIDWVQHYVWRDSTDNSSTTLDADNNVYVTGYAFSGVDRDLIVLKYDSLGTLLWSNTYDNGGDDVGTGIKVDINGNVFVCGTSYDATSQNDVVYFVYSSNGTQLAFSRYDAGYNLNDEAIDLKINNNGGDAFVIGTSENGSNTDALVIKINSVWSIDWANLYDSPYNSNDIGVALTLTSNNDIFCTGNAFNGSDNDIWVFMLNNSGSIYWNNFVTGNTSGDDLAQAIVTSGDNAVVCGQIYNSTTNEDYTTFRIDGSANIIWKQDYDNSNSMDFATSLVRDSIGNIGVTGLVLGGSGWEYHTIMYDSTGNQFWVNQEQTGLWGAIIEPRIAVDTVAHHFYVSGSKQNTTSDVMVYQITPFSGSTTWRQYHDGPAGGFDVGTGIAVSGLGVVYLSANEANTSWGYNQTTIRLSQTPVYFPIDSNNVAEPYSTNHYFYPNTGEIIYADTIQKANEVLYYTLNTYPRQYILNNHNIAFVTGKKAATSLDEDSLHRVDIEFWKGNPLTQAHSFERVDSNGILNYFLGHLSSPEITDVKGSKRIMIPNIYHNIDLHLYSNSSGLKMYWVVKPNTDPVDIIMKLNGSLTNTISGNKLVISTKFGDFSFEQPHAYYVDTALTTFPVTCSWNSLGSDKYSVTTGAYNPSWPLVIQMVQGPATSPSAVNGIDWSTYFGGSFGDMVFKTKALGNELFIVGETSSNNFPQSPSFSGYNPNKGAYTDGFVSKFKQNKELAWTCFVGGENGDRLHDLDFHSNGDIYAVGTTNSFTLGTATKAGAFNDATFAGGFADGFIFQLNSVANAAPWITYFGGNGDDELMACKFDSNNNFFVTGSSSSSNIATVGSGAQYQQSYNTSQMSTSDVYDGIIMKFTASNGHALNWFTFLGTSGVGENDHLDDIAVTSTSVYVCGTSQGSNMPSKTNNEFNVGNYDGIVALFSNAGVMDKTKYTDGSSWNHAIALNNNKVYLVGYAGSGLSTVNSGSYYFDNTLSGTTDAVFSVHSINLTTTTHNSYLGGNGFEDATDIEFAPNGACYITGNTTSSGTSFPLASCINSYYDNFANGQTDYFLTCIKDGTTGLLWSTYFGGPKQESHDPTFLKATGSIALDASGKLYLGGSTDSYTFFPLDDFGGPPAYFQSFLNQFGDLCHGSVTMFDLTDVNTVIGIREIDNSISFGLYPNPTKDVLTFTSDELINQSFHYKVYNLAGLLIIENTNEVGNNSIDVSSLPQGLYVLNIITEERILNAKFIKTGN